jgi:hypothetical protein
MLVSAKQRERCIDAYGSMTKKIHIMHRGHNGSPDLIDDHLPERVLGSVYRVVEPSGNTLKGSRC